MAQDQGQEREQSATHAIAEAAASGSGTQDNRSGESGSRPEMASNVLLSQTAQVASAEPAAASEEDDPTSVLAGFKLERVLDQDAKTRSAVLLGSFASQQLGQEEEKAVILLEKTHFEPAFFGQLGEVKATSISGSGLGGMGSEQGPGVKLQHLSKLVRLGQNDVYNWLMAWRSEIPHTHNANGSGSSSASASASTSSISADMKINVIRPATPAHISKYERQEKILVRETPEMYARLVRPWIEGQPAARINWVYNILEGKKEKENVLYRDEDPVTGFVVSVRR